MRGISDNWNRKAGRKIRLLGGTGAFVATTLLAGAWTPGGSQTAAVGDSAVPLTVNTADRSDVLSFYHCIYAASENYATIMGWTGNVGTCTPGTTSPDFRDDVRRRINFYRAMAGLPADIEFDADRNAKAQAAALMMSAHNALSHTPPSGWSCYTADGAEAAQKGNLALAGFGVGSVDGYMEDFGGGNEAVGHRRWLLYPRQTVMGTGDVPSGGQPAANCIYVVDSSTHRGSDPSQGSYYSWPPSGFVPSDTVWPRWSLHFSTPTNGSPTFGSAAVSMKRVSDNANVPVTVVHRYTGGGSFGDPAIVWEPNWSGFGGSAPEETEFEVTVSGVTPGSSGAPASHTYRVTPVNVNVLTDSYGITGPTSPTTVGASYDITALGGGGADKYEVEVSSTDATAWIEGAEDAPTPVIIDGTTGGYDLREVLTPAFGSPGARTGSKAFHFTFENFEDQWFEIDRSILPTAGSALDFWNNFRSSVPAQGNRLYAEISTDGGGSWTSIWDRAAGGTGSAAWDKSWQGASVSLAAYAGQIVRIRFAYRRNGGQAFNQTGNNFGVFLDDITVTNSSTLGSATITDIGTATTFDLNSTSAGGTLTPGNSYFLRVRPTFGCKAFSFSDALVVTAVAPTGYDAWVHRPTVGPSHLDFDLDGLSNGFEYGFGLDPSDPSDAGNLPQPTMPSGNQLELTMTEPAGVSGVTYGADWSSNLVDWFPMTDTGSGTTHTFLATSPASRLFVRWTVVVD